MIGMWKKSEKSHQRAFFGRKIIVSYQQLKSRFLDHQPIIITIKKHLNQYKIRMNMNEVYSLFIT